MTSKGLLVFVFQCSFEVCITANVGKNIIIVHGKTRMTTDVMNDKLFLSKQIITILKIKIHNLSPDAPDLNLDNTSTNCKEKFKIFFQA